MSNIGKIHISPGRGLQKYRILGEDGQCVAVEIEGRSGHKTVTTMSKYHFQSLVNERKETHGSTTSIP